MPLPHATIRSLAGCVATAAVLALLPTAAWAAETLPPRPVEARIDARETSAPLSPLVYGQFIEHIGDIINDGLWAEMLDDRKFYHPVLAEEPAAEPARFGRRPPRRWTSIGPAESVAMDSSRPFAGDHSPLVALDPAEERGIRQGGLAVVGGKAYSGRVVLAGATAGPVKVSLGWGAAASERQSVTLGPLEDAYTGYPLAFTAGASSDHARLVISATGRGSFRVGAVSLMPGDNVEGFRAEVVAALRSLRSGVYRFPGATSCPPTNGAMRSASPTGARRSWTRCGTRSSRTTSGPTSS